MMGNFHRLQYTKMFHFHTSTLKATCDSEHNATQERSEEAATQVSLSRPANGIVMRGVMQPTAQTLIGYTAKGSFKGGRVLQPVCYVVQHQGIFQGWPCATALPGVMWWGYWYGSSVNNVVFSGQLGFYINNIGIEGHFYLL